MDTACNSFVELHRSNVSQGLTSEVLITFPADNVALESTEVLLLELELSEDTQASFNAAGNIFFRNTSIVLINDTTGK